MSDRLRKISILAVVILQALFLLGLAGSYYAIDVYGKAIKLKTAPIDPRDIFYGDYLRLNYEISRLPLSLWQGNKEAREGQAVYVGLKGSDGIYQAVNVYAAKKQAGPGETLIKGRIQYMDGQYISVKYGIERYYIPENTGKQYEQGARQWIVEVKVAPWGQAKVDALIP